MVFMAAVFALKGFSITSFAGIIDVNDLDAN